MKSPIFFIFWLMAVSVIVSATNTLDLDRAQKVTILGWASYCNQTVLTNWKCFWCAYKTGIYHSPQLTMTSYFSGHLQSITGYAGYTDDEIVVAFRGTVKSDLLNWITDINYISATPFSKSLPKARAHAGFVHAYEDVQTEVRAAVAWLTAKFPSKPILFVGHSLGGALTTLAAIDTQLEIQYKNPVQLWTLGSPRVGNDVVSRYVAVNFTESVRMTNHYDIIPRVPSNSWYVHVGTEYWSRDGSTSYQQCANTLDKPEDPKCIASLHDWQISLSDHLNYMKLNSHLGCH